MSIFRVNSVLLCVLQNVSVKIPHCMEHKLVFSNTMDFLYGRTITKLTWRLGSGWLESGAGERRDFSSSEIY